MTVDILRFTHYEGKGNAVAFADVAVHENGCAYEYKDVKLYRDKTGLKVSPKQVRTGHGWAYAYLIPRPFRQQIRRALVARYKAQQIERAGQLCLAI
jgi:DNA-binding cell septation regulator SpoVG